MICGRNNEYWNGHEVNPKPSRERKLGGWGITKVDGDENENCDLHQGTDDGSGKGNVEGWELRTTYSHSNWKFLGLGA